MKIKDLTKAELEAMSYDDIALMILTESKKQLKINELFKKVCDILEMSEQEFMDKLPSFFDCISTDHRFIMLENGLWDLKSKHSTKVVIDPEDEEEEEIEDIEDNEDMENEEEEDIYSDDDETDDIDTDDDLKDLVIIDEEDETSGM